MLCRKFELILSKVGFFMNFFFDPLQVSIAARSPMILSPNALPIATPTNYVFSPKTAENKVLGVPLYPPLKAGRVRWPPAQFSNSESFNYCILPILLGKNFIKILLFCYDSYAIECGSAWIFCQTKHPDKIDEVSPQRQWN